MGGRRGAARGFYQRRRRSRPAVARLPSSGRALRIAAADTWRLNNAVRAEPLYPHKVAGMRSQTRLTIEAFEGL